MSHSIVPLEIRMLKDFKGLLVTTIMYDRWLKLALLKHVNIKN